MTYKIFRKFKHFLIHHKFGRIIDKNIRIIFSYFILFFSIFRKTVKPQKNQSFIFFLYGGIGDCLMQLPAIFELSMYSKVIVIIPDNFQNLFINKSDNLILIYYNKFNIFQKTLNKIRKHIKKDTIGVLFSSTFENYILFKILRIKYFYGFIGFNNKYRSIGIEINNYVNFSDINKFNNYNNIVINLIRNFHSIKINSIETKNSITNINFNNINLETPEKYIMINVNKTKNWPAGRWNIDNFVILINELFLKYNINIILTGSKDEFTYVNSIYNKIIDKSRLLNFAGMTTIAQTFYLIYKSE